MKMTQRILAPEGKSIACIHPARFVALVSMATSLSRLQGCEVVREVDKPDVSVWGAEAVVETGSSCTVVTPCQAVSVGCLRLDTFLQL